MIFFLQYLYQEELLIFMELCSEGTLESLVEMSNGLHEGLTRRYTAQLLDAVAELHKHQICHRDVKPANIFLTKSGNCLKLGDFGSAVKIQAHTTIPGELQAYVGTQAYMVRIIMISVIHIYKEFKYNNLLRMHTGTRSIHSQPY